MLNNIIDLKILNESPNALPKYETTGSAGLDLRAWINETDKDVESDPQHLWMQKIEPREKKIIRTGIKIAIPLGYELQIRTRSGMAANQGLSVLNSPGTIDSDYRGYINIILFNHSNITAHIYNGDRIAQAILSPVYQANLIEVSTSEELGSTDRGEGGFGSTGTK